MNYWITGPEVAALLGCTPTTVYRMVRGGRLPEPHCAHGWLLFLRHQLEVIANAPRHRQPAATVGAGTAAVAQRT